MRRLGAVMSIVVGAAMVVGVFALSLPTRARHADEILAGARPSVVGSDLLRADLEVTKTGVEDLVERALPATAAAQGVAVDELMSRFPATSAAIAVFDEASAAADATVGNLERQEPDFRDADRLRSSGVPLPAVPWLLALTGLVLVGLGAMALAVPARAAVAGAVITALGVLLVAVPLGIGAPAKIGSAADVLDSLKPDPAITAKQRTQLGLVAAASKELPTLLAAVEQAYAGSPAITAMVESMPDTLRRYGGAIAFREQHGADVADLHALPLRSMAFGVPLVGVVMTLGGLLLLVGRRRQPGLSDA